MPPVLDVRLALVAVHVSTAVAALVVGAFVLARRKGDRTHRRLGTAYAILMAAACASATALLAWRFNPFLAGVTALSAYTVSTATRAIAWRRSGRPGRVDVFVAWLGFIGGGAMAAFALAVGAAVWPGGPSGAADRATLALLGLAFGAFLVALGREDLRRVAAARRADLPAFAWLDVHMARIVGSYIALTTAFAVQASPFVLPDAWQWLAWVAPGLVGGRVLAPPFVRRERARWVGAAGDGRRGGAASGGARAPGA